MNRENDSITIYGVSLVSSNGEGGSGGDTRFFEILKHIRDKQNVNLKLITTQGGSRLATNFGIAKPEFIVKSLTWRSPLLNNLALVAYSLLSVRLIKKKKSSIVYNSSDHLYDAIPCSLAVLLKGAKWVAVVHWVEDKPWKNSRGETPFLHRYSYWIQRLLTRLLIRFFASSILAVSSTTAEKLLSKFKMIPKEITPVKCGVNFNESKEDHFIVKRYDYDGIFIKRLSPGKGVNDLVPIWKNICQKFPDAKLAIIGDGHPGQIENLRNHILNEGLEDNIDLLGPISERSRILHLLKSSRVFLLPTYEENWAIVIGEALGCGVPVVSYDLRELTEIWGESVTWAKKGDVFEFSNRVLEMMTDSDRYDQKINFGINFVKELSWDNIAENEFHLMRKVIYDPQR